MSDGSSQLWKDEMAHLRAKKRKPARKTRSWMAWALVCRGRISITDTTDRLHVYAGRDAVIPFANEQLIRVEIREIRPGNKPRKKG